ncbi:P22 phage major capsid protein family protein [Marinibaculum pumilum]|uniref:P22 phage major capsid protein family protein n=1 Tax=Marinibaculum pumilum TaxID=1766165 RepID=A0ABV7L9B3_9PROT
MANAILTPTQVTREALRILHQKLRFVGSINRQYDDSFAQDGAKIGDSLKIRLPNEYTVRTGRQIQVQDTSEQSVTLQVATQKGVDMAFTSKDLTLDLDDFSKRILEPAMAVLAANIEADALSMYRDVANEVSDVGSGLTLLGVLNSARVLTESLAPMSDRCLLLNPTDNVSLVEAVSGLFNPQKEIGSQFREGMVANQFVGYQEVYETTLLPIHLTGTEAGPDTGANVGGAGQSGSTVTVNGTVTGSFRRGDIVCFEGCNAVHPETKADLGVLKQFTVTADVASGYASIPIAPAIVTAGARQNVAASPTDAGAVLKVESDRTTGIGNAADYAISMGYHRDAFAFATADLVMPKGVDFAAREVFDGISMRVVRQYDINNDNLPCRIDVLYGHKAVRPDLACRIGFN